MEQYDISNLQLHVAHFNRSVTYLIQYFEFHIFPCFNFRISPFHEKGKYHTELCWWSSDAVLVQKVGSHLRHHQRKNLFLSSVQPKYYQNRKSLGGGQAQMGVGAVVGLASWRWFGRTFNLWEFMVWECVRVKSGSRFFDEGVSIGPCRHKKIFALQDRNLKERQ